MSKSSEVKSGKIAGGSDATPSKSRVTMKAALGAGALALVLGGLVIVSRPDAVASKPTAVEPQQTSPAPVAGQLVAMQTKFNFGPISMANGKVTHRFPVRNNGTEPIVIRKMYTSCMCTTVALVKDGKTSDAYGMPGHTPIPTIDVPVKSRDEVLVEVVFDPAAHGPAGVGPIERVVTLENSAGQPLELEFAALVTP